MKLDEALEAKQSKYTAKQYKFISELIWGGVPVNRKEAEESPLFKSRADKILEEYPKLDVSFFEKHKAEEFVLDGEMLDEVDDEDEEDKRIHDYLRSDKFKEDFRKQVEKDTWGQGLPMVYMNKEGQIVRHYSDGKIEVIKDKES
jgi:hypothetical protein